MTRDEFSTWASDLTARFPQTGEWVRALPAETRNVWFQDVFAALELRDCLAVNLLMMKGGELEAWQRERLPAIFIKRCSELRYAREQANASTTFKDDVGSFGGRANFTPVMRRALAIVQAEQRKYRADNDGRRMPDEQIDQLVEVTMSRIDHEDNGGPRYKCPSCRDSGLVSYRDERQRYCVGHCSCTAGIDKRDKWSSTRKNALGVAPSESATEWDVA